MVRGRAQHRFSPFEDFLIGHGWAVLRTNPRGSTGYGAKFAAANHNDMGGADYRDIMAGVDFVLKTSPVDPTRMALMGDDHGPLAQAMYGAPVAEPWHGFDARRRVVEFIEKAFH